MPPENQLHAKAFLELADARGQRRLRDAEAFGGTAEVFFLRDGEEHLEFRDHAPILRSNARFQLKSSIESGLNPRPSV
jgi:hypothetical protein